MNTAPIVAARTVLGASSNAQSAHALLARNGLPARWQGRERFTMLETGFGPGTGFLAAWAAWRADADRCRRLHFVSIEAAPFERTAMASIERDSELLPLAAELAGAWPPLTCNLHRLSFENGAVELSLAFGDAALWLRQLSLEADALFLDATAAGCDPSRRSTHVFKALARLAAPGATFAARECDRSMRDGLRQAGFDIEPASEQGGASGLVVGRYAPKFEPRGSPRRRVSASRPSSHEPVVIVGGGLAGSAVASALAEAGLSSVVLERNAGIAQEASGNAAGLFHGVVHVEDGRHARFFRAAALAARTEVGAALGSGVPGSVDGLLRLEFEADIGSMRATAARLGLPNDYARAVTALEASVLAGTALNTPAWFFANGGWVDPRALCAWWLQRAGTRATVRPDSCVAELRRDGGRWLLLDSGRRVVADAATVVLADGTGSLHGAALHWPVSRMRGQLSSTKRADWPAAHVPRLPITGAGYVLPAIDGAIWFGAATQPDEGDTSLRDEDHRSNLERARRLLSMHAPVPVPSQGRTGFRWVTDDRLPIIGAVPDLAAAADPRGPTLDRPRLVPRLPGLYAVAALGSRGIASAVLGARVIAASIGGGPSPIEADLLDAIDPARFVSRAVRRAASASAAAAAASETRALVGGGPQAVPVPAGSAGG